MPTYEYECNDCGNRFERFQNITEDPLKKCPECEGVVRRLISAGGGLIFKGKGFYQTDYKNSTPTVKKKSEDKPAACPNSDKCPCK